MWITLFACFGGLDDVVHLPRGYIVQVISNLISVTRFQFGIKAVRMFAEQGIAILGLCPVAAHFYKNPIFSSPHMDSLFNPEMDSIWSTRVGSRYLAIFDMGHDPPLPANPVQGKWTLHEQNVSLRRAPNADVDTVVVSLNAIPGA